MTQDECKLRYVGALSDFLDAISSIDQDTPADTARPEREPGWWLDMMDDWRAVQPHYIKHKQPST